MCGTDGPRREAPGPGVTAACEHPPKRRESIQSRRREPEYGPFSQPGTLDGIPIVVGGQNDPVPVHLEDGDRIYHCLARRDLARRIAAHLFTAPLRVSGTGVWLRNHEGIWVLKSFHIHDYLVLKSESAVEATKRLQAISAEWKKRPDPLGDLVALRKLES